MTGFEFLLKNDLLRNSLEEQNDVLRSFWEKAKELLHASGIEILSLPEEWKHLKHNYFSVIFIAILRVLNIPYPRFRLYTRLNHCLRSWVTACDNLLDNELKEIILTNLPCNAKIFKSFHTALLTDRIFFSYLIDAFNDKIISSDEMRNLLKISLNAIATSGVEEAQEEGGIDDFETSTLIIEKIHYEKTGKLFTSILSAPLMLGDISMADSKVQFLHNGLIALGIGCQILDDISDLSMDLADSKHNYLASILAESENHAEKQHFLSIFRHIKRDDRSLNLYQEFPHASSEAFRASTGWLKKAFHNLNCGGLHLNMETVVQFMTNIAELYTDPENLMFARDR